MTTGPLSLVVASAAVTAVICVAVAARPNPVRRPPDPSHPPRVGAVMGAVTDAVRRLGVSVTRRRARRAGPAVLAAWIDELARAVGHGRTLRAALSDVVPADQRLAELTVGFRRSIRRGSSVRHAGSLLGGASSDVGEARRLSMLATMLGVLSDVGGSVGQPLDRLAAALRESAFDEADRRTHAAQAESSVRVLTVVPFAMLGLLFTFDADVRHVVTQPLGAALVAGGTALAAVGAVVMRRIVRVS